MRFANFLDSLTIPKLLVFIAPFGSVLFTEHYMWIVLASIAGGVLLSKTKAERIIGAVIAAVWLIWGQTMGPWVPLEKRGSWEIVVIPIAGYMIADKLDRQRRFNNKGRD